MTNYYEIEKNKIVCKELYKYYVDYLEKTNNDKLKFLFSINNNRGRTSLYYYVNEDDYNKERDRAEKEYSTLGTYSFFTKEEKVVENNFKILNPTIKYVDIELVTNISNVYTSNRYRIESCKEALAKEISKLSNYNELFEKYKIKKKIQTKLKEREKRLKKKVATKSTSFNYREQKKIVFNIFNILMSKEGYKDHPLTYFFRLFKKRSSVNQIDTSGKKLSDFFDTQLNDDQREELVRDLLDSKDEACKRFAMFFDKSNAIIGALDNNEFVRKCAGFLLKEEDESEKEKERD